MSLSRVGDRSEANTIASEVSQQCVRNENIGPSHFLALACADYWAEFFSLEGHWEEAVMLRWEVFESSVSTLDAGMTTSNMLVILGNLAWTLEQREEAECAKAMRLICFYLSHLGWRQGICNEPVMLESMHLLAHSLGEHGSDSERLKAFDIYLKAIRRYKVIAGYQDPNYKTTMSPFSVLCIQLGKYSLAKAVSFMVLELMSATDDEENSYGAFNTRIILADMYVHQGKILLATSEYEKLLNQMTKAGAYRFPVMLARLLHTFGCLYERRQLPEQAQKLYKQGIDICQASSCHGPLYTLFKKRILLLQKHGHSIPAEDFFDLTQQDTSSAAEEIYSSEKLERLFAEDQNQDQTYEELLNIVLKLRPDVEQIIEESQDNNQVLLANLFKYTKNIYDKSRAQKTADSEMTESSELSLPPSETKPLPFVKRRLTS